MKKKYLKPDAEFLRFQTEEHIADNLDIGGRYSGEAGDEEW